MKRQQAIIQLLLFFLFAVWPLQAGASDFYGYTRENPLIIVCDWDFRPFEYQGNDGRPHGYNVEVLELILSRLDIPHRFVMQDWSTANRMFERREADLLHAIGEHFMERPYVMTHKYISYYRIQAAHRKDTPPLKRLFDLPSDCKLLVKKDDYASNYIARLDTVPFGVRYCSPRDGLAEVSTGEAPYYLWGSVPLENKIHELALDNLVLDDVDIPPAELHIIGYDSEIVDLIDDEYTRLEQAGELQVIYDRWFRPELVHDDASPLSLFILLGLTLLVVVVLLFNRLVTLRVRSAVRRSADLNRMMTQALHMGAYYVVELDMAKEWMKNAYGNLLSAKGMSEADFISRMADVSRDSFVQGKRRMKLGECDEWQWRCEWNSGTAEEPCWRTYDGHSIVERKADGQPRHIVHTMKDVTHEMEEEAGYAVMGSKYMQSFQTNMVATSLYDASGQLLDLNHKMRQLFARDAAQERYFRELSLFDAPIFSTNVRPGCREPFYSCYHVRFPSVGIDMYAEVRLKPLINEFGQIVYYIVTCRDITSERDLYMSQRQHDRQLTQANEVINQYDRQLRYLLDESKMYIWRLDFKDMVIRFSRTLQEYEYNETVDEYMAGMDASHREEAQRILREVVMKGQPYTAIHLFDYTPVTSVPTWFSFSGMPARDETGKLTGYFGIVRDITELMTAQEQLRQETLRAENSGRLKSAFLANMTHEIRTPLNAIVGFSDLLQEVETTEERAAFIRIIRNNCDMLLRLINDILEASSMSQSLAVRPEEVDLPRVFDDICQTLAQRVEDPGVTFLKDNPIDHYRATLDKGRLMQLLTNFVTNAVKYTHKGHIRVGWRPMAARELPASAEKSVTADNGLYFYCEDTGDGIPKEKQPMVFDRFVKLNDYVQGTGLGLSICKAIVDKCGGRIGVESEEGRGSTFWFWMPTT